MPSVTLGALAPDTIAPTVLVLVERGVEHRPGVAAEMSGSVALIFDEGYPTVRISFGIGGIVVEDSDQACEAVIEGRLPDHVALIIAPLAGGVPNPLMRGGRGALGLLARGNVTITGSRALARQFLRLISLR